MNALTGWLKRLRKGDGLKKLSAESWDRVCTVLEELEGVGCRVEKSETGHGWKIIVDGSSDVAPPDGTLAPLTVLHVGPTTQTDPALTQVAEDGEHASLADALRVVEVSTGVFRVCIDLDRVYVGSVSAGKWRPLSDFFGVGGASGSTEIGLKLSDVIGEDGSGTVVSELPTRKHTDGKVYPKGAYLL